MIEFAITHSPDQTMLGTHFYFRNLCVFGQSMGDILIFDPAITNGMISLELDEKGLLCHKQPKLPFYLKNGKRTITDIYLLPGDSLQLGQSKVTIKSFLHQKSRNKNHVIQENLQKIYHESQYEWTKLLLSSIRENSGV